MLSEGQVEQFRMLYEKHFDKEISPAEAVDKGTKLVCLLELIGNLHTKFNLQYEINRKKV
ncbi:MAG: hypothetical protein AAB849_01980 [Patescibacteria group bacterium]